MRHVYREIISRTGVHRIAHAAAKMHTKNKNKKRGSGEDKGKITALIWVS